MTSLVTSLFSIIVTICFHRQLGIAGTLAAVAISYGINFLFLVAVMKLRLKWRFCKFRFVRDKKVWGNIGLMQLNILPVWVRNYVTLYLLSGLGEGIVSSVNLAQQAAGIIDTLIIVQVLSVAGIKFNELYAKMDFISLNELFIRIANNLLLLLMPVVLITFFYADDIAAIIFKRGHMAKGSLATVALCLKYLILLSPFTLLNSICTRIFSSTQVIRQGLLYSMLAHVIFLVLTVLLINLLHLKGYLYSMLAGYSVLIFLFYRLFKLKLHQIDFGKVLIYGAKQLIILKKLTGINYIILLFIAACIQVLVISYINRKHLKFSRITDFFYGIRNKPHV
jgi:peptidoglycan biosynthesis protein MviN/MurJ (putative lipid II flippase)